MYVHTHYSILYSYIPFTVNRFINGGEPAGVPSVLQGKINVDSIIGSGTLCMNRTTTTTHIQINIKGYKYNQLIKSFILKSFFDI